MLSSYSVICRNKNVITKKIQNEFIVLDAAAGKLYKFNSTAEVIWKYLWRPRSLREITEKIIAEFLVNQPTAETEASEFIKKHLNKLFFLSKSNL